MESRQTGTLALALLAFVLLVGGVVAFQRSQQQVLVDSPAVRIETNKSTGKTTVDAPFAHVEKDASGTHIEAPGVDVQVPKKPAG
jgi:hypothetical protein